MNRSIDAASTEHSFVGCVYDGIYLNGGDVALLKSNIHGLSQPSVERAM